MTPKEKAQELYELFRKKVYNGPATIREVVILCVDEIIKTNPTRILNDGADIVIESKTNYWQQVKEEINNM